MSVKIVYIAKSNQDLVKELPASILFLFQKWVYSIQKIYLSQSYLVREFVCVCVFYNALYMYCNVL